jgi:hypothetical protein
MGLGAGIVYSCLQPLPNLSDGVLLPKRPIPARFDALIIHVGPNPEELLTKVMSTILILDAQAPQIFKKLPSIPTIFPQKTWKTGKTMDWKGRSRVQGDL